MSLPADTPPDILEPVVPPPHRRWRAAWLLTLSVLLVAAGAFFFSRKPVPPPQVPVYTPRQTQEAQSRINSLREQFLQPEKRTSDPRVVQREVQKRGPDLIHLQLSQADLNAYLATDPHVRAMLAKKRVQAVQVILHAPREITVRASVLYHGKPQNVQVEAVVRSVPDAPLQVTATGAQVGRLPLPSALVTAQANKISAQFAGRAQKRLPLVIQDVRVVGDHLVLTGIARNPGTH